jgi:hypothetical protein
MGKWKGRHMCRPYKKMKNKRDNLKYGQAMIEFVIGLVGLLILLTMVFQGVVLTKEHTDAMTEARAEAGANAISALSGINSPDYVSEVDSGSDWKKYTEDDIKITASSFSLQNDIVERSVVNSSDWDIIGASPRSSFNYIKNVVSPVDAYGLVSGASRKSVTLSEAFKNLIWNKDSIDIDVEVWMTHTDDIY